MHLLVRLAKLPYDWEQRHSHLNLAPLNLLLEQDRVLVDGRHIISITGPSKDTR